MGNYRRCRRLILWRGLKRPGFILALPAVFKG